MIPRSQFTRIADEHEVDAKTVERDYVLTQLASVYRDGSLIRDALPDAQEQATRDQPSLEERR